MVEHVLAALPRGALRIELFAVERVFGEKGLETAVKAREKAFSVIFKNGREVFVRGAGRHSERGFLRIGRRQKKRTARRYHAAQFLDQRLHLLFGTRFEELFYAALEGPFDKERVALQSRLTLLDGTFGIGKKSLQTTIFPPFRHEVGKRKTRQPQAHVALERATKVRFAVRFLVDVERRRKEEVALDAVAALRDFRVDLDFLLDFELFGAVQLQAFLDKHGRPQNLLVRDDGMNTG